MTESLDALVRIVRETGQAELLPRFRNIGYSRKSDGSLVTEADMAAHEHLIAALTRHTPGVDILSEEMSREEQQSVLDDPGATFWLIDPLDGTSNFVAGFPMFSISVALIEQGEPVIGLTYDPSRDECFYAERGVGAWLDGESLGQDSGPRELGNAVALVDFKRLSEPLRSALVTGAPYASQRNIGTSALEWVWMAARRGHLYLHGGQKLWDQAAGSLILHEAGGCSETLSGEDTFALDLAPRSVVASPSPELFSLWRDWIRDHR